MPIIHSKSKDMARVWVKGFTKSDGTKVKGHYRDVDTFGATTSARERKRISNRIAAGKSPEKAYFTTMNQSLRGKVMSVSKVKQHYGRGVAYFGDASRMKELRKLM